MKKAAIAVHWQIGRFAYQNQVFVFKNLLICGIEIGLGKIIDSELNNVATYQYTLRISDLTADSHLTGGYLFQPEKPVLVSKTTHQRINKRFAGKSFWHF